jgi:hypothetical protein
MVTPLPVNDVLVSAFTNNISPPSCPDDFPIDRLLVFNVIGDGLSTSNDPVITVLPITVNFDPSNDKLLSATAALVVPSDVNNLLLPKLLIVENPVPDVPLIPDVPLVPDVADVPDEPDVADVPLEPEEPDVPDVPLEPFAPDVPEEPEVPEVPAIPSVPDVPRVPDVADVPDEPEVPSVAEVPDVPVVPEVPPVPFVAEVPDVPEVAEVPDVPLVPAGVRAKSANIAYEAVSEYDDDIDVSASNDDPEIDPVMVPTKLPKKSPL